MEITCTVVIQAAPEVVWEMVGPGFGDIGRWAVSIPGSRPIRGAEDGPVVGRVCEVRLPTLEHIEETLIAIDHDARELAYVGSGLPAIVVEARNHWSVEPAGADGSASVVTTRGHLRLRPLWAVSLALPLRLVLRRQGNQVLSQLRHYAEHGEPILAKRLQGIEAHAWRRPRFEVVETRRVRAAADVAWALVSDQSAYGSVAPSLRSTTVLHGSGVGMRRQCELPGGGAWEEVCVSWKEGSAFELDVDVGTYPVPLRQLFRAVRGRWAVRPAGADASLVTMRLAMSMSPAAWLLKPYLRRRMRRETAVILDAWTQQLEPTAKSVVAR